MELKEKEQLTETKAADKARAMGLRSVGYGWFVNTRGDVVARAVEAGRKLIRVNFSEEGEIRKAPRVKISKAERAIPNNPLEDPYFEDRKVRFLIPLQRRIKLADDSIWKRRYSDEAGNTLQRPARYVEITDIIVEPTIIDGKVEYVDIFVKHNHKWEIYTDTGFEKGISDILTKEFGKKISAGFSEQGMQRDGRAHMEVSQSDNKALETWIKKRAIKTLRDKDIKKTSRTPVAEETTAISYTPGE